MLLLHGLRESAVIRAPAVPHTQGNALREPYKPLETSTLLLPAACVCHHGLRAFTKVAAPVSQLLPSRLYRKQAGEVRMEEHKRVAPRAYQHKAPRKQTEASQGLLTGHHNHLRHP